MKTGKRFWAGHGNRLRTARLLFKLTEKQAAEAAGVTVKTWRAWEAGGRQKSSAPMMEFGRRYRVSFDWLYDGGPGVFYVDLLANPPRASIYRKPNLAA